MNNSLFEFPFIAEVWGTVSDWVMVCVTAITAYYLYQTLQEQKEFTKIELERYARENPPTFTSNNIGKTGYNTTLPQTFKVRLENNQLKNLSINVVFPTGFSVKHNYTSSESLLRDSEIVFTIDSDNDNTSLKGCHGTITFKYNDMLNNRYIQVLEILSARIHGWNTPNMISN